MMLVMLAINYATMFLTLPRRYGMGVSIIIPVLFTVVYNLILYQAAGIEKMFGGPWGLVHFPVILLLFKGRFFQKLFAFFLQLLFTIVQVFFAGAIAGIMMQPGSEPYNLLRLTIALAMFTLYCILIYLYGRHFFQKLFIHGRRSEWALYAFGAIFSFFIVIVTDAIFSGMERLIVFLYTIWSFAILCFAIINTHEKSEKSHEAETLTLQMNTMRHQIEAEDKYRSDLKIMRHDMRHDINIIMELFRTGKSNEAEKVYETWLNTLSEAAPVKLCAEPVLNAVLSLYEKRAKEKDIILLTGSQLPPSLPVDTLKLSIVLSNALENALTAAEKIPEKSERIVNVKLIYTNTQFGLEIVNPSAQTVEFDGNIPVTHEAGHGIGIRSIIAFAEENNYLLDFKYLSGMFTMRLIMRLV